MKITKEDIEKLEQCMQWHPDWEEEHKELIRLARLGLWAEEHGIPVVKNILRVGCHGDSYELVEAAIVALPKTEQSRTTESS